jgi:predicted transcriptional regulator
MPLNGDVKTFPLAAIVQMVHDERKTGILAVSAPRRRCSIYFREGNIIHVRGNTDKEMKLGALLKANNLISEDRLEDMLAVSKAMEKRLGTVLLERNYIDLEKLVNIIHLQFKEGVSNMLSWEDAKFSYKDGLDGFTDEIKCEVDPVRLVLEAKKREEFKGLIPNDQVVFQINPNVDTSKSVHAARDLRSLLLLDGRRTVAQLIKETGYSRLAAYRSLAKLYAENAIVRKGDDRQPTKRMGTLELSPITTLYWNLLQLIMTDLAEELGADKATSSLENSLRQSAYYERFLKPFQLDQDLATNINRMESLIQQQGQSLSQNDLVNGFNQVLVRLLGEQYQFLGYKGTRSTVKRMRASLESVPATHRPRMKISSGVRSK